MRLVRLGDGVGVRVYLTNVCDPQMLALGEIAQLYARRWDIEMAFRLRKRVSGNVALVEQQTGAHPGADLGGAHSRSPGLCPP